METKRCISCCMPMETVEQYPNGDTTKTYCVYCARDDGSMKSWDEAVIGYTAYLQESQGIEADDAREQAIAALKKCPAWKDL